MKYSTTLMSPKDFNSSFISCERDMEAILRKLFISSRPYSDHLKKLLVINNKDCLDNDIYDSIISEFSLTRLREEGYIKIEPKIEFGEHAEIKAYVIIEFNNFTPNNNNPEFRDCIIDFNIICHTECWDLGDYRLRPIKIMGYIDGILNKTKLSGIGELNFIGANEIVLDENLSGYLLRYAAIHPMDDSQLIEE